MRRGRIPWRLLRWPFWLLLGAAIGFAVPYLLWLDHSVRARFGELAFDAPSRVYARPLALRSGLAMNPVALELELAAARYTPEAGAPVPGTYERSGSEWTIHRREFVWLDGREQARRLRFRLEAGRVRDLRDAGSGDSIALLRLEPARIATLYGARQQDRRLVRLGEVPPLLVAGLQAVEDRSFKHHRGIAVSGILRAAWANLRAGGVVQGGSTLTQQLVKNLFLDRSRSVVRKLNEAALALLIEARFDKGTILEAYLNEVFLGQQGGQAIHGFAAAAEFHFGRDLATLDAAETALLVGLVQGPSLYDPRRHPERALARRNRVLAQFHETGLIDSATLERARGRPLGAAARASAPRNRYPAFVDLVRRQLRSGYAETELARSGLSIHTTLAPSTQVLAERALAEGWAAMGAAGQGAEAALVVTAARTGEVEAMIGGRAVDAPGFNRALDAVRPVGSLVKPFVNLVALSQPQRYSLASVVNDVPVDLPQRDGSRWQPQNDDRQVHGEVLLVDALVHSWNLATVNLGLQVGVERVRAFLESFRLGRPVNPNPSLLLGALELSPFDVTQLYQYLAADGRAVPLRAVHGVMDASGRPLARYATRPGAGDYSQAARLVTWGLQRTAEGGTARAIGSAGLGWLNAAGKTGTSDSQRDSWFAGWTGDHLAVAWVGRDDNAPTRLFGATGALRVWIGLVGTLPTSPLELDGQGLEYAWVTPSGKRSDPACEGARRLPFVAGYLPQESEGCVLDRVRGLFSGGQQP